MVIFMKNDEIVLTPDTLLNWDFKIDARGYRPQEVDKALDIVISDYRTWERKERAAVAYEAAMMIEEIV